MPEDNPPGASEFDPVRQLEQRIAAERLRLQLREVEEAHNEMDRRAEIKDRERQREVAEQAAAKAMAQKQAEDARRRESDAPKELERHAAAEDQRRARRREIIQSVKTEVMAWWVLGTDLKAQALQEIEHALTILPVEDLPRAELIEIARGIRDRLSEQARLAQANAAQLSERRQRLIAHGLDYVKHELAVIEDLNFSERWRIEQLASQKLADVSGNETTAEIEDSIEDILDREGIGWDDEDE